MFGASFKSQPKGLKQLTPSLNIMAQTITYRKTFIFTRIYHKKLLSIMETLIIISLPSHVCFLHKHKVQENPIVILWLCISYACVCIDVKLSHERLSSR